MEGTASPEDPRGHQNDIKMDPETDKKDNKTNPEINKTTAQDIEHYCTGYHNYHIGRI